MMPVNLSVFDGQFERFRFVHRGGHLIALDVCSAKYSLMLVEGKGSSKEFSYFLWKRIFWGELFQMCKFY